MDLNRHLFSVSELNNVIKTILESSFPEINLEGEISNFRPAASGHWYFSLRDRDSIISSVMFRNSSQRVSFKPSDGMKVKVKGKLSLYSQRGTYQIVCSSMTLFGEGDLLLMIEERKRKLAQLGYFDQDTKKPIPRFPKKVGIITSPTGAALQDILKVINRRGCLSDILIYPTLVQGLDAPKGIVKQLERANRDKDCDVLIVTRGGGSIEDLLPFSDEGVVEAIYNSTIPVISGVGHEIDTSLCDLAADFRVATPSAAGEVISEGAFALTNKVQVLKKDLIHIINAKLLTVRSKLSIFNRENVNRIFRSKLENLTIHLDNLKQSLIQNQTLILQKDKNRLLSAKKVLLSLSPVELFKRGYSWVSYDGKSINSVELKSGDIIDIKYLKGNIKSEIQSIDKEKT